jgi:mycothiol synthase
VDPDLETAGPDAVRLVVTGTLPAQDVAHVFALVDAATVADGVRPLSEHVTLHVRYGGEGPDRNLLLVVPDGAADGAAAGAAAGAAVAAPTVVRPGERLAGYAHLDPTDVVAGAAVELVVHPRDRGLGHGRVLVEAAAAATPDGRLRLWAHGDTSPARSLAASLGFKEVRRLEQLRRSLWSPLPNAERPAGVTVRAFRPGADDAEWLALNARAFADHPEQGGWTAADLAARMREDWFDPEGFLVAVDDATGAMVAFHWTKIHGGDGHTHGPDETAGQPHAHPHAHDPIGEVYVVGVDPAAQGRGLGRAMTLAGLHHLRGRGLPQAMLYVDADNAPALAVYKALGFTHWDTDVMFSRRG